MDASGGRKGGTLVNSSSWVLKDIAVSLDELDPATEWALLHRLAAKTMRIPVEAISTLTILRESLDARRRDRMAVHYSLLVTLSGKQQRQPANANPYHVAPVSPAGAVSGAIVLRHPATRPVVVGAGPCGLFCALALAQAGVPAIVLERGKPVEQRQADVMAYWHAGQLDPESNVQFGEGGAGTFSDGKLTTRIHDPRCDKVLETFVACGAPPETRWRAKPHLGTDVLAPMLVRLRKQLVSLGTTFLFQTRMDELMLANDRVVGVRLADGTVIDTDTVALAIGHSARDTFSMLHDKGVVMTPKPFSVGVRIEHPQTLINQARYGGRSHYKLGAAEYQLFERFPDRTAYTFCMCPGGTVVAAASEPQTIVTNGMSDSTRQGGNANSAFVVSVDALDVGHHPLDGVAFQRRLEQAAFRLGGNTGAAPVQCLADFLVGQRTVRFGAVQPTYTGNTEKARLDEALPGMITARLREAIPAFARRLNGFSLPDALLTGFETRTSSPVRMLRNTAFQAQGISGLYPAGEGAGYAGGIMSAAVDGLRVAEAMLGRGESGTDAMLGRGESGTDAMLGVGESGTDGEGAH